MRNDRVWKMVLVSGFLGLMVDGMDLMFLSYSLPSLMKDFGIGPIEAGSLASYTLVGMGIGGFIGGWAADRYGRVRAVVWSIVLFSLATSVLALSQTYGQFAALRFVSALGLGAEYVVSNTLMAEYVPTSRRTTVLGTLQSGWSLGYVCAALLARTIIPTYGWRPLFAIAVVPVVLALVIRRAVPEPPSWSRSAGAVASTARRSAWRTVFATSSHRRMFLLWAATSTFLQFGYYGVANWLPTYLVRELGVDFTKMTGFLIGTYIASIVGKVVAGWLADRYGRRIIYVLGGVSTALFLPVLVMRHTPETIVPLLALFGFLYGIPYGVNATYMTESFSTEIRATAVGGAYNLGRAGAAVAPALIGLVATRYSIGLGLMTMGAAYLLTGLIPALFIREKLYDPLGRETPGADALTNAGDGVPGIEPALS
jgi:MFS transporter, AAHS family, cis,cis-muconate transporter